MLLLPLSPTLTGDSNIVGLAPVHDKTRAHRRLRAVPFMNVDVGFSGTHRSLETKPTPYGPQASEEGPPAAPQDLRFGICRVTKIITDFVAWWY